MAPGEPNLTPKRWGASRPTSWAGLWLSRSHLDPDFGRFPARSSLPKLIVWTAQTPGSAGRLAACRASYACGGPTWLRGDHTGSRGTSAWSLQSGTFWGGRFSPCSQAWMAPGLLLSGSWAIRNYVFCRFFLQIFGQTWLQNPSRTTGLVLQCRLHQKSAPQTNSKTISWQFVIRKSPPPMTR